MRPSDVACALGAVPLQRRTTPSTPGTAHGPRRGAPGEGRKEAL